MKKRDILDEYVSRMPQKGLSDSFREQMMQRIFVEKVRMEKRQVRNSWISLIAGVLFLIGIAVWAFIGLDLEVIFISVPLSALSAVPFYGYIGFLALLLLGLDYKFRKVFRKKFAMKD